jgi:hypothetical protein
VEAGDRASVVAALAGQCVEAAHQRGGAPDLLRLLEGQVAERAFRVGENLAVRAVREPREPARASGDGARREELVGQDGRARVDRREVVADEALEIVLSASSRSVRGVFSSGCGPTALPRPQNVRRM